MHQFKVGDMVYCCYHEETGRVVDIIDLNMCPVIVEFSGNKHKTYTLKGEYVVGANVRLRHLTPLEHLL